jgi:hypothetical protein
MKQKRDYYKTVYIIVSIFVTLELKANFFSSKFVFFKICHYSGNESPEDESRTNCQYVLYIKYASDNGQSPSKY